MQPCPYAEVTDLSRLYGQERLKYYLALYRTSYWPYSQASTYLCEARFSDIHKLKQQIQTDQIQKQIWESDIFYWAMLKKNAKM